MFASYVNAVRSNLADLIADGTDARAIEVTRVMLKQFIYEEFKVVNAVAEIATFGDVVAATAQRLGTTADEVAAAVAACR
jgi:hypothetical protein